ncbi:phosphoglycerate mutase-like protein [Tothia fuscella]|uniref:Phosphoglycerate mutase-like protein n=1 Tax=Tothia fuscella TaxID=1048955 RepID=A0A9P4NSM5_9PEZI|nr:phosphoglycerate mutase-like protein [Tothia fuscella]
MRFAFSLLLLSAEIVYAVSSTYKFDPLKHLAGIAPYFEPQDPELDPAPPQGCSVTRAAYLVRHAAIYANDFDYESYIEPFLQKLKNSTVDWRSTRALSFLETWQSPIADQDQEQLTLVGMLEAQALGVQMSQRYLGFKAPGKVWTSTAERTVKSAESLIEGLVRKKNTTTLIQISEGEEEGANSLTPYKSCPAYSSSRGSAFSSAFGKQYTTPIIARFKSEAPSFNFTSSDIIGMQELCGYETVIRGSSPFCSLSLFPPNDWLSFEYMNDLMYHQNTGYGNPASGVIGLPWLSSTAALLMEGNSSSAQDLYISFTHRELPPTVLVAMGLFNNSAFSASNDVNATMPNTVINHRRAWQSSRILPFLTNIAVEQMQCSSFGFEAGEYYRVSVNQSPQPLPGCADGPGESCSRSRFTKYLGERQDMFGGFSAKCGTKNGNSTDVLGIYTAG